MKNLSIVFTCSSCGSQYPKWVGRCTECQQWGTVVAEQAVPQRPGREAFSQSEQAKLAASAAIVDLGSLSSSGRARLATGIAEFDRTLGGGFVPGSLTLLGGEPGVGKSTLVLQAAGALAQAGQGVLYLSGEESAEQLKGRAERLAVPLERIKFLGETNIDLLQAVIRQGNYPVLVVDSVQTVYSSGVPSEPGSVAQVRACTVQLLQLAKETGVTILLVGHVTKDGLVAGPKLLEHLVDAVLYLTSDEQRGLRLLKTAKNRFGSTQEVGVFRMEAKGLVEVANPSGAFLDGRVANAPGSVVTAVVEGSRSFLVEVQALVSKSSMSYPRRTASGFDLNRLQLLLAVLTQRVKLDLAAYDVYLNVAGGLELDQPSADLAVALAIASAFLDQPVPSDALIFGEVGLAGEVRPVGNVPQRLAEAGRLGFSEAVGPAPKPERLPAGFGYQGVRTVGEAMRAGLGK